MKSKLAGLNHDKNDLNAGGHWISRPIARLVMIYITLHMQQGKSSDRQKQQTNKTKRQQERARGR